MVDTILRRTQELHKGRRKIRRKNSNEITILAPVVRGRKGVSVLQDFYEAGFYRFELTENFACVNVFR